MRKRVWGQHTGELTGVRKRVDMRSREEGSVPKIMKGGRNLDQSPSFSVAPSAGGAFNLMSALPHCGVH